MSQLESFIVSAPEAPMDASLTYSLAARDTSIVDRKTGVHTLPASASSMNFVGGPRESRIRVGGDDFVDANSFRLQYTIVNNDTAKPLVLTTGGWGCLGQVYLRSGGQELDNVFHYGRFHTQYLFNQTEFATQWGAMGVGGGLASTPATAAPLRPQPAVIPASGSLTVSFPLGLSMLASGKILPTRYCPLDLIISLVTQASDWLDTAGTNSTNFSLANIKAVYHSVTLDEAVQASFYKLLLAGRVLSMPVIGISQSLYRLTSSTFQISATRAFSRLAQVWITFKKDGAPTSSNFPAPADMPGSLANTNLQDTTNFPTARLQIGPKCWPSNTPLNNLPEMFNQFQSCLTVVPNITRNDYETNSFSIGWDLKRLPSDVTTSISTRSGDTMVILLTGIDLTKVDEVWLTLLNFSVCAIRESGVTLLT
jgi:hypothetical protein